MSQPDQAGVPAVRGPAASRIMRVFEILSATPLTAAELGRELGSDRSTALRLATDLTQTGYVTRDGASKRYQLAKERFLALATGQVGQREWLVSAMDLLEPIRQFSGDSAIVSVPVGLTMAYVAFLPTLNVVGVSEGVGAVRPMHCSGQGKAYLSGLSETDLEDLLARMPFQGGSINAAKSAGELRELVLQARRDGYALDLEESFEGVRCVAAPLRAGGQVVGAIGVSGPASRLPMATLRDIGVYLRDLAAQHAASAK